MVETLVDLPFEAPRPDDPVQRLADRYFDVVLVHADARLGRLEDTFDPQSLRVPILYTGFIGTGASGETPDPIVSRPAIVISCDGARPDVALFRAALSACEEWLPRERLPLRIIAGPALPDRDLAALPAEAIRRVDVIVERGAGDLAVSAHTVAVSVNDGAGDTVFEMLRAGVPSLVVVGGWGDNERAEWAHRLAALGIVALLERDHLSGAALAAEITATMVKAPPHVDINRSGAEETSRLIARLADPAGMYLHAAVSAPRPSEDGDSGVDAGGWMLAALRSAGWPPANVHRETPDRVVQELAIRGIAGRAGGVAPQRRNRRERHPRDERCLVARVADREIQIRLRRHVEHAAP